MRADAAVPGGGGVDPVSELLTYSRLSAFRACPKRHFYRFEIGLAPEQDGVAMRVGSAFHAAHERAGLTLADVYTQGREHEDLYQLAELLTEWDERVGIWRFRHFKVVARIIGEDVVGTQGTPVELLAGLIKNKMFPELWRVRTELTELAKESD